MADPGSRFFFLSALLVSTLFLLHHPIASEAHTLFVFGDGFYDVGNKQFLSKNSISANAPPYGITIGEATGRWSDGLIVSDYLAGFMRIPRIAPILDTKSDFSHGASFAVAGATVVGSPPESMNLGQQVKKFSELKHKWTEEDRAKAIFLVYIGGEDYLDYVKRNPNRSHHHKQAFVDEIISGIAAAIKAVYRDGGRKFAIQNLPPLGCLPAVRQEHGEGDACVNLPSELAFLHNKKLLRMLPKLARELKGFQYAYYDFFGSIQRRVSFPPTYRFIKGDAACCGVGPFNGADCEINTVCHKPPAYLFFDGKHLTQEANFQIGQLIWSSDSAVISPNNLRELLYLPLDIPFVFEAESTAEISSGNGSMNKTHNIYDMGSFEYILDGVSSLII